MLNEYGDYCMKKMFTILWTVLLVISLAACSSGVVGTGASADQAQSSDRTSASDASELETLIAHVQAGTSAEEDTNSDQVLTDENSSEAEVDTSGSVTASAQEALAENQKLHSDADDYTWEEAEVISIELNGDSITTSGAGVTVEGSKATITSAGTYRLSGTLAEGQIIVDSAAEKVVRLLLNGVSLSNSTTSPINIVNAEEVVIILLDGTENTIADGPAYVFADPAVEEPDAAIFSAADLTIYGSGSLTVSGNYNDGINSKDGLIIAGGNILVNAVDDGLRGKDYLAVEGGNLTVNAQGDGLKADNEEEAERGYIFIEDGVIHITAAGDALTAATDVVITGGNLTLSSGGGSGQRISGTTSAKGIKAAVSLLVTGGSLTIDSADDALNTNGSLVIDGGTLMLASGDDGMHADATLEINAGEIQITQSYEGIESAVITINDGTIHVVASDDGLNVSAGMDGSGRGGGMVPGQDNFTYTGDNYLYVNGGYIAVNAGGDGVDSNGGIEMTGGVLLVNGPTENMNGPLDFAAFNLTGGYLVASGSAGMAQAPGQASSQNSIMIYFSSTLQAGTLVRIQNSAGEELLTFAPVKEFQSLVFSSPELVQGETYEIYTGGSSGGTAVDSLILDGTYEAGEKYESVKLSGVTTTAGSGGGFRPGRP
jgi:hypothetical protein